MGIELNAFVDGHPNNLSDENALQLFIMINKQLICTTLWSTRVINAVTVHKLQRQVNLNLVSERSTAISSSVRC